MAYMKVLDCLRQKRTQADDPGARELPGTDQVIGEVLNGLSAFREFFLVGEEIIKLFIRAARLSPNDIEDFSTNPALFYSVVYDTNVVQGKLHPRRLARNFLGSLVDESGDVAASLLAMPLDECLIRCVRSFLPKFAKHGLVTQALEWFSPAIEVDDGPVETATKIFFLTKTIRHLPAPPDLSEAFVGIHCHQDICGQTSARDRANPSGCLGERGGRRAAAGLPARMSDKLGFQDVSDYGERFARIGHHPSHVCRPELIGITGAPHRPDGFR
jgi:hypothetical protein